MLAQNQGKLLTHRMLLREVWGPAYQVEAHYLHVYVSHLRAQDRARSVAARATSSPSPGAGYRLVDPTGILRQAFRVRALEALRPH